MEDSSVRRTATNPLISLIFFAAFISGCSGDTPVAHQPAKDTIAHADSVRDVDEAIPGRPIQHDSSKRYIYLTFDDGPQNGTMHCYQVVQELGVKASFFMIGVQAYEDRIRRKVDSIRNGYPMFLLCNHTYTHANHSQYTSFYTRTDSALRDIEKNQAALQIPLKILRMPGHNSWSVNGRIRSPKLPKALCAVADSAGYAVAGWDVEWHFKHYATPVEGAEEMIRAVQQTEQEHMLFNRNHIVILAHDRMFEQHNYTDSLRKFITLLKRDPKNVFETIDHYPGISGQ